MKFGVEYTNVMSLYACKIYIQFGAGLHLLVQEGLGSHKADSAAKDGLSLTVTANKLQSVNPTHSYYHWCLSACQIFITS